MEKVILLVIGTDSDIHISIVRTQKFYLFLEYELISEIGFAGCEHDENFLLLRS